MNITRIVTYISAGVLAAAFLPRARADEWNQKTVFTFSAPVEIPGRVLPAGTYVFKLLNSDSDRNVVEVYNKRENHLYGIFLAIPDYHLKPASKPIISFEERAAGAPEAVKAWFYPGDNFGHRFVYPKTRALELAKANNESVPSMPNALAANTTMPTTSMNEPHVTAMRTAPLKAQQPNQEEAEITEVFPAPPPPSSTPASPPNRLPQTGSTWPLIGLVGLVSLVAGGSVRFLSPKIK